MSRLGVGVGPSIALAVSYGPLVVSPNTAQSTNVSTGIAFTISGGSGSYTKTVPTNNSGGGSWSGNTYTTGTTGGGVTDVVRVTDNVTNAHVDVNITVYDNLAVSPNSAQTVVCRDTLTFTPSGGSGSYSYAMQASGSGSPTFVAGVYTAGATQNGADTVRVTDTVTGQHVDVSVTSWGPLNHANLSRYWNENIPTSSGTVTSWNDDKASQHYSTVFGSPTVGVINGHNALSLPGGNSNRIRRTLTSDIGNAITLACVFKCSAVTNASGAGGAFPGSNSFSALGIWFGGDWNSASGKVSFGHTPTGAGKYALSNSAVMTDNTVHRAIGVYDGAHYTLYIDGVAQTTVGAESTNITGLGDALIYVGAESAASGAFAGIVGQGLEFKATALAGTISDVTTDLGKLDRFLQLWAGQ